MIRTQSQMLKRFRAFISGLSWKYRILWLQDHQLQLLSWNKIEQFLNWSYWLHFICYWGGSSLNLSFGLSKISPHRQYRFGPGSKFGLDLWIQDATADSNCCWFTFPLFKYFEKQSFWKSYYYIKNVWY